MVRTKKNSFRFSGGSSQRKSISRKKSQKKSKLSINEKGINNLIPYYEYIDKPSFTSVVFNCKKGQGIVSQSGKMSYMDDNFNVKTGSGGIWRGLKRKISGASFFQTTYVCTKDNSKIAFANFLLGDMFSLKVNPGENLIIASNSVVCYTSNINVSTKPRVRGLLLGNMLLNSISIDKKSKSAGMVWLSSFGGYKKISVKEGEKFKLDNGLFLASHSYVDFKIGKVGKSFITTIKSGEGLVMTFTGPAEIYIQTRNDKELVKYIKKHSKKKRSSLSPKIGLPKIF